MIQACRTYKVDPDRLEPGRWSHEFNQQIGEGDITGSYCADAIALYGTTRKPFVFRGGMWVCVGTHNNGSMAAKSYKMVPLEDFEGQAQSYAEKTHDDEEARNDPNGFYHGITVTCHGHDYVLCGPPVHFIPGQVVQPGLFGEA